MSVKEDIQSNEIKAEEIKEVPVETKEVTETKK